MRSDVLPAATMQPWNQVVFPSSSWAPGVLTAARLRAIPAIGRGLALTCGMAAQMPLDDVRGDVVLPRPRLLHQPDPDRPRSWFVGQHVEDYLVHGNAVHLVTTRDKDNWPATVAWIPAQWVDVSESVDEPGVVDYWVHGRQLPRADVVHVRRGADPWNTARGIGVVEQYMIPLQRMVDQDRYESGVMNGSAVPSVAVIVPNPELSTAEADEAKERWVEKFAGPVREPVILPAGTEVKPLAWSPNDAQLAELRKLSLTDAANMLNIDGYWLGAESTSLTYKSPGPMYLNLIRQTVGPILEDIEGTWTAAWLPRGRQVTFLRRAVQGDDMQTTVAWVRNALAAKLITQSEGRTILGFGAEVPAELLNTAEEGIPA